MKRVIFLLILFILFTTGLANARLLILTPNEMISKSDYIVEGTVTEKNYSANHRKVKILVESCLKWNIMEKEIILEEDKPTMYGWQQFDFPDEGTRVMLFLQKGSNGYSLTGEANGVVIIKNNREVELYKGLNTANTVKQYEEAYTAFLKANEKEDAGRKVFRFQNYRWLGYLLGVIVLVYILIFFIRRKILK